MVKYLHGDHHNLMGKGIIFAELPDSKLLALYHSSQEYSFADALMKNSNDRMGLVKRLEKKRTHTDDGSELMTFWTYIKLEDKASYRSYLGDCIKVGSFEDPTEAQRRIKKALRNYQGDYVYQNLGRSKPHFPYEVDRIPVNELPCSVTADATYVPFENHKDHKENLAEVIESTFITPMSKAIASLNTELINILIRRFEKFMGGHLLESEVKNIIDTVMIPSENTAALSDLYVKIIDAVSNERLEEADELHKKIKQIKSSSF